MRFLINIDVPELEPAIAFYRDALGLRLARRLDADVAELVGGPCPIYLLEKAAGSPPADGAAPRDYARHWSPVHLDFVVDDLEVAVERAVAAGARQESGRVEWRGSRCITFADPFGHGFCLIAFDAGDYTEE